MFKFANLAAVFGPDYKTSLFGLLSRIALVCGAISAAPAQINFLPDHSRATVLGICGLIWFIFGVLKDFNTADAAPAAALPKVANGVANSIVTKAAVLFIVALYAGFLAGCAATQSFLSSPAGKTLETNVTNLVQDYASTGNVSQAQAIEAAMNSISALAGQTFQSAGSDELESLITDTVQQFTGDAGVGAATTGQKIAQAVVASLPTNATASQVSAAVVAAGVAASNGANAVSTTTAAQ